MLAHQKEATCDHTRLGGLAARTSVSCVGILPFTLFRDAVLIRISEIMATSDTLDFVSSVGVGKMSTVAQSRIDSRTFSAIRTNSSAEFLRQFEEAFARTDLRSLVRRIDFDVILPPVSEKRLENKFQSSLEAQANSTAFSRAVMDLFARLSSWDSKGIALRVTATSPSDDETMRATGRSISVRPRRNDFRYIGADLAAIPETGLPKVYSVSSLDMEKLDCNSGNPSGRRLHPDLLQVMMLSLPMLESAKWEFFMPPRSRGQRRQEFRAALAAALDRSSFSSLQSLCITLHDVDPRNEDAELESFVGDTGVDDLSAAVQGICNSPTLTTLRLCGKWSLSSTAFERGFGPSVSSVYIDFSSISPSGNWLFDSIPHLADEDETCDDYNDNDSDDEASTGGDLYDFNSADSDEMDNLDSEAEDRINFFLPAQETRGRPNADNFVPLFVSVTTAAAKSFNSLAYLEAHLMGGVSQVHLGYFGCRGGQGRETAEFSVDWPHPWIRQRHPGEELDKPTWYLATWGAVDPDDWKIPGTLRAAMESCPTEVSIMTHSNIKALEFE